MSSEEPEEKSGKEESNSGVAGLIPEVYYDLIARVPAGGVLVVFTLSWVERMHGHAVPEIATLLEANNIPILVLVGLLMGLGGLVGIIISPVAAACRKRYWKRAWIAITDNGPCKKVSVHLSQLGYSSLENLQAWSSLSDSDLEGVDRWTYDYLLDKSSIARSLLPKLRAEADLCNYLAAAFFLLPFLYLILYFVGRLYWFSGNAALWHLKLSTFVSSLLSWLASVLLCLSGAYRTKRLLLRMLSMVSVISARELRTRGDQAHES